MSEPGSTRQGLVLHVRAWSYTSGPGHVRQGMVWSVKAWSGPVRHGLVRHGRGSELEVVV